MRNKQNQFHGVNGFTLIEIMIAVAVVAILAAVAFPSYNASVQKSRRTVATTELEELAAEQERYYYRNNVYSQALADFGYTGARNSGQRTTTDGFYRVQIVNNGAGACNGAPAFTCTAYQLRARPFGSQVNDPWIYRLFSDGRKQRCMKQNTTNFACVAGSTVSNWAD